MFVFELLSISFHSYIMLTSLPSSLREISFFFSFLYTSLLARGATSRSHTTATHSKELFVRWNTQGLQPCMVNVHNAMPRAAGISPSPSGSSYREGSFTCRLLRSTDILKTQIKTRSLVWKLLQLLLYSIIKTYAQPVPAGT